MFPLDEIPYTIVGKAPEYNGSYKLDGILDVDGGSWLAPDRQNSQYANSGDPSFCFVIDLAENQYVHMLKIKNCVSSEDWCEKYRTEDFEVSMSASPYDGYGTVISSSLKDNKNDIQEFSIKLTGRYLKFKAMSYGSYSAALTYLGVFKGRIAFAVPRKF